MPTVDPRSRRASASQTIAGVEMKDDHSTLEVVDALYCAILGRAPTQEEVAHGTGAQSLREAMVDIVDGEEARRRSRDQVAHDIAFKDVVRAFDERPMNVRADDVMNALAGAYENHLGRHPSFMEVAERFRAILAGSTLTGEIAGIVGSLEAARRRDEHRKTVQESRDRLSSFVTAVYARCLLRGASADELDFWYTHHRDGATLPQIFFEIDQSEEAAKHRDRYVSSLAPGMFVQLVFELVLGRGASPMDIDHHRRAIESNAVQRADVLASFFDQAARRLTAKDPPVVNDPMQARLFGRAGLLTPAKWREREARLRPSETPARAAVTRFPFVSEAKPLVSIITSLYRGGAFIEGFLENITSQSVFADHCELLIIDADSPDGELEIAKPYLERFPNIRYRREAKRIGIYEAWNIGIRDARGAYCTNANIDDCRRTDSLELQASTLDALPFVDIVYQDILYSYADNLPFSEIERYGFSTDVPIISRYNLLEFNSPHNGPMWRKTLHKSIGMFDETYRSAADFDFWLRCAAAGKTFYKLNDPHIAYYVNPRGVSTRSDTLGIVEADRITKAQSRRMIAEHLVMTDQAYADSLAALVGGEVEIGDRYRMAQAALRKASAATRVELNVEHCEAAS